MQTNNMKGTTVCCSLQSCRNHRSDNHCSLSEIEISPCCNCGTGKAQDETMCASYCCK